MLKLSLCLALLGLSQCWMEERARVVRDYLHYTGWSRVTTSTRNLPTGTKSGTSNGSADKIEHFIIEPHIYINFGAV